MDTAVSQHMEPVPRKGLQHPGEPPRSTAPQELVHAGWHRSLTPQGTPLRVPAALPDPPPELAELQLGGRALPSVRNPVRRQQG